MNKSPELPDIQAMYEEEWRLRGYEHIETVRKALNAPAGATAPKIVCDYVLQLELNLAQQLARSVVANRISKQYELGEHIEPLRRITRTG